ncbi:hypothetical protein QBC35DRAFT_550803, partial [Podospora australis]
MNLTSILTVTSLMAAQSGGAIAAVAHLPVSHEITGAEITAPHASLHMRVCYGGGGEERGIDIQTAIKYVLDICRSSTQNWHRPRHQQTRRDHLHPWTNENSVSRFDREEEGRVLSHGPTIQCPGTSTYLNQHWPNGMLRNKISGPSNQPEPTGGIPGTT